MLSTKITLKNGTGYHFYKDTRDHNKVFLDIDLMNNDGEIIIGIPMKVWNEIVEVGKVDDVGF